MDHPLISGSSALDSITETLADHPPWAELGFTFAVTTFEIDGRAPGAADCGRSMAIDGKDDSSGTDQPASCSASLFGSTMVDVIAPEGYESGATSEIDGTEWLDRNDDATPDAVEWNVYALACCWPLGRSADVHFASKMPPKVLAGALRIYLEIQPDELLLAIIDRSGGRSPSSGCASTTRRFHWAGRRGGGQACSASVLVDQRGQPRPPLGRSVSYGEIAEVSLQGLRVAGSEAKSTEYVPFGPLGLRVPGELPVVLQNLGRTVRGERVAQASLGRASGLRRSSQGGAARRRAPGLCRGGYGRSPNC